MKGYPIKSVGRVPLFAACLIAAAVSIFCFVPQRTFSAEQTISAQWVPLGSGQEPLIDLTNTYSYESSAWQETPGRWKVWFCGGDPAGRLGDSVFYTVVDTRTAPALGNRRTGSQPSIRQHRK
jgi:hypothetical protein